MDHFSFGVFLLDFGVCSKLPSQSWVASIAVGLAAFFSTPNLLFSHFCDTPEVAKMIAFDAASYIQ